MTAPTNRPRTISSRVRSMGDFIGGVMAVASAADAGRRPSRRDLIAAGIDPESFYSIHQR